MAKLLNCTETANLLGISKAQVSYWLKSPKLEGFQNHIYKDGKAKLIDIILLEELFKLNKKEMPDYLKTELNFAITNAEFNKVVKGKSIEVELEIYKNHAETLQDELELLKLDLANANEHIKSLESLLQTYYEKVGKALERNIELLENLEPLVKNLPANIYIPNTPINKIEEIIKENKQDI